MDEQPKADVKPRDKKETNMIRKIHPSTTHFICPTETPPGERIGLTKDM